MQKIVAHTGFQTVFGRH